MTTSTNGQTRPAGDTKALGSVVRALRILDLVAQATDPPTLTEMATRLGIPKSTTHNILGDLIDESFLSIDDRLGYSIGLKAFEIGAAYLRRTDAVEVVAPELIQLTRSLDVSSHFATLDGSDAVYLCKEDPTGHGVRLASSVGARLPAHLTAVGKACLAWLHPDQVADHVALAARARETLGDSLRTVREIGYAFDDGETATGIQCVAAPVFDLDGCCGAVGVSYLRGLPEPVDSIGHLVIEAAARTSTRLGGRVPR